ncbi:unnamed protein product, partial [Amoebophrya sp. A25]
GWDTSILRSPCLLGLVESNNGLSGSFALRSKLWLLIKSNEGCDLRTQQIYIGICSHLLFYWAANEKLTY